MIGTLSDDYLVRLARFQQAELTREAIKTFSGCSDEVADELSREQDQHQMIEKVTELRLKQNGYA